MEAVGLYIHIPFCRAKCNYCDFNSYAGLEGLFEGYTAALIREIEQAGPAQVKTIYVGGGTPTVLPLAHLGQVLHAVPRTFAVVPEVELTVEANPGTVDARTLAGLKAQGANRLSLGVQSFDDEELHMLGRIHTAGEALDAYEAARHAGFDNVNLDLIYGLPRQPLAAWLATLERALALEADHLSLYALTIEESTPLSTAIAQGHLPAPDPDLAADMYEAAEEALSSAGYLHYEISNWARDAAHRCQHNMIYWRNEPYLGMGAGAHSWVAGHRRANAILPDEYAARVLSGARAGGVEEWIDPALEMGETMMMGLRLVDEGVAYERFKGRFGIDLCQQFAAELEELTQLGLIETDAQRVRLSRRGRLLGNQVFLRFLPA
jgi:oxygen-independent coproporphyrinogen-3 oxidase